MQPVARHTLYNILGQALPLAVGFGISRPEHVAEVGTFADAAVVGSALVSLIAENRDSPELLDRVEAYIRWLKCAVVTSEKVPPRG